MFLRILVIFSLFLSLAFSQTAVVRVGKYPDKERIVLQLDRKVDYKVLTLESPKRTYAPRWNPSCQAPLKQNLL